MAATQVRVTLRYVEILDRKDLDDYGEFVLQFTASVPESETVRKTRIPEKGHLSVSDHPSMNRMTVDTVLFEGPISDGQSLVLEAHGEELDKISGNDPMTPYRRKFAGPVSGWVGEHTPWDEGTDSEADPEQLGDWRFGFAIETVG